MFGPSFRLFTLCVGLAMLLAACQPGEMGIPPGALPPTVTQMPGPTATHAPTLTVAPQPTPTPTRPPTFIPGPGLGRLAYVQGGDIWVKTLPDAEPQRLTDDGRNSVPRWSPSGQWLAFRKGDYQFWVMRADGTRSRSLVEEAALGAFAWAPAGDRLAYVAGGELWTINAGGTDPAVLVPQDLSGRDSGRVGRIAWSPDGAWIAYEWLEKQPDHPLAYEGLWKVAADGGRWAELYNSGAPEKGVAILVGWFLDGQYLFFWQGDILSASMLADGVLLYVLPADGGAPVQLAAKLDARDVPQEKRVLLHADFIAAAPATGPSPGAVAIAIGGYRATWTSKRVGVVDLNASAVLFLTPENLAAFSPAWSPGGTRLAFVAMSDEGDLVGSEDARLGMMSRRIWVATVDGASPPRQLTGDPAYRDERPLWSADGAHILFVRMDDQSQTSLWLMPFGEGVPHLVAEHLGPLPGPAPDWLGNYGHVDWDSLFDWWREPIEK